MVIRYNYPFFTVQFEKEDWNNFTAYRAIEYIKSLPRKHHWYVPKDKLWHVLYKKEYKLELRKCSLASPFSIEDNKEGKKQYDEFMDQFS